MPAVPPLQGLPLSGDRQTVSLEVRPAWPFPAVLCLTRPDWSSALMFSESLTAQLQYKTLGLHKGVLTSAISPHPRPAKDQAGLLVNRTSN